MGTFYVDCTVANITDRDRAETVKKVLVDTGSDYTWLPGSVLEHVGIQREKKDLTFTMANGERITRNVGFAIVRTGEFFTVDEIVFAGEGDLSLLGARSLEGFNARVDSKQKRLVAAGPLLAAGAAEVHDLLELRAAKDHHKGKPAMSIENVRKRFGMEA